MRILQKSCPRCHGDMGRVEDVGDTYFSCVQCGYVAYSAADPQRGGVTAPGGRGSAPPRAA